MLRPSPPLPSSADDLIASLDRLTPNLQKLILAIAQSVREVADLLRDPALLLSDDSARPGPRVSGGAPPGPRVSGGAPPGPRLSAGAPPSRRVSAGAASVASTNDPAPSRNIFGDQQIAEDLATDRIIFSRLKASGVVHAASSEETPDIVPLGGRGFFVAFDPLDGSSIMSANFSVGSIFVAFEDDSPIGKTGNDAVLAAYAVYGPKTSLMIALRDPPSGVAALKEFVYSPSRRGWMRYRVSPELRPEKKICAPGNLRAAAENPRYRALIDSWINAQYTLRYSGGMVPDIHHLIAKGGGVFLNPLSTSAPAKLRLLYECIPLSLIVEAAGGAATDGRLRILDIKITSTDQRTHICLGSTEEVRRAVVCMT